MRVGFSIFTLLLVLSAPFWLYLPVIACGIILLPNFVEAIPLAMLADFAYGGAGHGDWAFGFPLALTVTILLILAIPLREQLRFDE